MPTLRRDPQPAAIEGIQGERIMPQKANANNTAGQRKREPGTFFQGDNLYVDAYAPLIGSSAVNVYQYMLRWQTRDGRIWRHQRTMADALKISRPTVAKAIDTLFRHGLIALYCPLIERQDGNWRRVQNHSYQLVEVHPPVDGVNPPRPANDVGQNNVTPIASDAEDQTDRQKNLTRPAKKLDTTGKENWQVLAKKIGQNNTYSRLERQIEEADRIRGSRPLTAQSQARNEVLEDDGLEPIREALFYGLCPEALYDEDLTTQEIEVVDRIARLILDRKQTPTIGMVAGRIFRDKWPDGDVTEKGLRSAYEMATRKLEGAAS